jgi:predicted phosphoribosyltransferase
MSPLFRNRREAGQRLAHKLLPLADRHRLVVLALPRGGVPVAAEIATELKVPFDVFVVRKLGVPGHEELAMGAVASGGVRVLNPAVVQPLGITMSVIEKVAEKELKEIERREREYRGTRPFPELAGATVILVDDGIATGSTMLAAVEAVRMHKPASVVVAAPVVSTDAVAFLRRSVDASIYLAAPEPFYGVAAWYADFEQVTDDEVRELLKVGGRQEMEGTHALNT